MRWSNELEKVQCLEQKVQQQAKMLDDYHDAEMQMVSRKREDAVFGTASETNVGQIDET